jgi:hypothetical protein
LTHFVFLQFLFCNLLLIIFSCPLGFHRASFKLVSSSQFCVHFMFTPS